MSDTNFSAVERHRHNIDIIDETWQHDCLSDDELNIPKELDIPMEDCEEEDEGELKEEEWDETGIEQFANETSRTVPQAVRPAEVPSAALPPA